MTDVAMRRSPASWLLGTLVVAIVFVGIGAVLYAVFVGPWVASPPTDASTIERRWKQVERWAAYDAACGNPTIDQLATAPVRRTDAIDRRRFSARNDYPRVERQHLPEPTRAGLAALDVWTRNQGGFRPDAESSGRLSFHLHDLGQIALATASDLEDPSVASALYTSKTLRRCGGLLDALAGFALADSLVRWLGDRGLGPDSRFETARPTRDELFAALARGAIASYELARKSGARRPVLFRPWYVAPFFDGKRELLWLKYDATERLFTADAMKREPARMATLYPENEAALPKSVFVRLSVLPLAAQILKADEAIRAYDGALARR